MGVLFVQVSKYKDNPTKRKKLSQNNFVKLSIIYYLLSKYKKTVSVGLNVYTMLGNRLQLFGINRTRTHNLYKIKCKNKFWVEYKGLVELVH